jgi:hypothetical protein
VLSKLTGFGQKLLQLRDTRPASAPGAQTSANFTDAFQLMGLHRMFDGFFADIETRTDDSANIGLAFWRQPTQ